MTLMPARESFSTAFLLAPRAVYLSIASFTITPRFLARMRASSRSLCVSVNMAIKMEVRAFSILLAILSAAFGSGRSQIRPELNA